MKRLILGSIIGLLTFAVGVAFSSGMLLSSGRPAKKAERKKDVPNCAMPDDLQEIMNVEFCELMRNPNLYDGRIVRTKAVMLAQPGYQPFNDRVSLGASSCERELTVNDEFHLTSRSCPEVMKTLDSLLMRDDPSYPRKNAKVLVVGRFISPKSILNLNTEQSHYTSERFTIIGIERAASIDDEDN